MDPNCPDAFSRDEEREEEMDPFCPEVAARDEEQELQILMIIAGSVRTLVGQEHLVTEENLLLENDDGSQFLNDSGERIEAEEIFREEEVPLTNSGEVY